MLPARAQRIIAELAAWAEVHSDLLSVIWERFAPDASWPNARFLSRELFVANQRVNVTAISQQMPAPLGRLDSTTGTIVLTVRGLSYVPAASPLLDVYVRLLQEAVARYGTEGVDPVIRSAEFEGLFELSSTQARQLEELASVEPWALGQAGGVRGDLRFAIDEHVVFEISDVQSVEDYLEVQARAWWPDSHSHVAIGYAPSHEAPVLAETDAPSSMALSGPDPESPTGLRQRRQRIPLISWLLRHDEIRIVDWIAIAVIAGLAVWLVLWLAGGS
jgi:hypothetical protein